MEKLSRFSDQKKVTKLTNQGATPSPHNGFLAIRVLSRVRDLAKIPRILVVL